MNFRHSRKGHRAVTAAALTTGLVLTMAGCGGGGGDDPKDSGGSSSSEPAKGGDGEKDSPSPSAGTDQIVAEVRGENGITLTVTSAVRDPGGFLTLSGKVTNGSGKFWVAANWRGDERELSPNGASMAGASVVDSAGKKKYLVLRDTQGRCLCTKFEGGGVDGGQSADWYAQFPAPPKSTTKVDFQVGAMPPASLEISDGQ
ncbi:hypothetical protein ACIQNU_12490 [Streptomyces sp. NPDC091292]|uniref:hypothetical protein n=1 Tax=Streptomyces sp. NPDC091292 TaxID=3365991 RepID=UPI00381CC03C